MENLALNQGFWLKTAILGVSICALCQVGNTTPQIYVERMVEAIGKAENSKTYPYGVKSIDTKGNVAYARKICRNSVVNNLKRWDKAGNPGSFIAFMGSRYAPTKGATDDPQGLNSHWVKNVTHFYNKGGV